MNNKETRKYFTKKTLKQICYILSMLLMGLFLISLPLFFLSLYAEAVKLYINELPNSILVIFGISTILSLLLARLFSYLGGLRGRD